MIFEVWHSENMVQFVYVTRKFPDEALSILTESKKLNVKSWPTENVIPREDLLLKVKGVNGLVCTISDVIDQEVLDAAGLYIFNKVFHYVFQFLLQYIYSI